MMTTPWPRRGLATLLALAGLAGCGPVRRQPAGPAAASSQAIWLAGVRRTFHVYRPPGLAGAAPLVVMLHGGFGTGTQAEQAYGWDAQARAAHFVVAYPDGLDRAWNVGGGCCGVPGRTGADDVGFITQLVARISAEVRIDPHRIYATGISNGGMLAYRLACATTIFAAIGPVAATQLGRCRSPAPVSVIHIHGSADRNVPYGGGIGQGFARIHGPAIPLLNASWRSIDQCAAPSVRTAGVLTTSVARCPGGRAVELITVRGAGHQWPGSVPPSPLAARLLHLDPPSKSLNATSVIWRFFASHHRAAQPG
jgi:polyhydroxybutyrate depolymerase